MSQMGQTLPGRTSSNSSYVGYAPKAEEGSLPVICLCGLMATYMMSFPRSSLLKGDKVAVRPTLRWRCGIPSTSISFEHWSRGGFTFSAFQLFTLLRPRVALL